MIMSTTIYLTFGIYLLLYPDDYSTDIRNIHSGNPSKYAEFFGSEDVDDVTDQVAAMQATIAALNIFLFFVSIPCYYYTVELTTFFEIVQGFQQHVNTAFLCLSFIMSFMAIAAIKYTTSLPSQVPSPGLVPFWIIFGLSVLCIVLSIIGFYAAFTERLKMLRNYSYIMWAIGVFMLTMLAICFAYIDFGAVLSANCKSVLQFVDYVWWDEYMGCSKYIGEADKWDMSTSAYVTVDDSPGDLGSLTCANDKYANVFAWEFNTPKLNPGPYCSKCVSYYGCLNSACCDTAVDYIESVLLFFYGTLLCLISSIFGSAIGAYYMTTRVGGKKHNNHFLNTKRSKAALAVGVLLVVGLLSGLAAYAAIDNSDTTSTATGIGDYTATTTTTQTSAESALSGSATAAGVTESTATLSFNASCLQTAYEAAGHDIYLAQLMQPKCQQCKEWIGPPPDIGCSNERTCISNDGNFTCTATKSSTCPSDSNYEYSFCDLSEWSDKAITNGDCKTYSNALSILSSSYSASGSGKGCYIQVSFLVPHGGNITFRACEPGAGRLESCQLRNTMSSKGDPLYNMTLVGSYSSVASAISEFRFCPLCVERNYPIQISVEARPGSDCSVHQSKLNMTIRASTDLEQIVTGSVRNGACLNSSTTECVKDEYALESVSVGANLPCYSASAVTSSAGEYSLTIPYARTQQNLEVNLSYSLLGWDVMYGQQTLGASSKVTAGTRYQWVSAGEGDYCQDTTTSSWAYAEKCAAGGIDLCAIYGMANPKNASFCQCYESSPSCYGTGGSSVDTPSCAGCLYGTSGPCISESGVCSAYVNDTTTCLEGQNASCTGWPCSCASATANSHSSPDAYLFLIPTPVPSPDPTKRPTPIPTISQPPTPVPTSSPTSLPSLVPTRLPTAVPSAVPTAVPTLAPSRLPTLPPTGMPTPAPSLAPSAPPSLGPSPAPTSWPTGPTPTPTSLPTALPNPGPTVAPSPDPTAAPTLQPTAVPTLLPTAAPSPVPTLLPTAAPTLQPTPVPTIAPTSSPSRVPTLAPTPTPTLAPTKEPVMQPTERPTVRPTALPNPKPTFVRTPNPTLRPTIFPTASNQCLSGVVVAAVDGSNMYNAGIKVRAGMSATKGPVLAETATEDDGTWTVCGLSRAMHTIEVQPSQSDSDSYQDAFSNQVAPSSGILTALAPALSGTELIVTLKWGPQSGYGAWEKGLGVPTDLDAILAFPSSGSEECLVYEGRESCGDAKVERVDSISSPKRSGKALTAAESTGVEVLKITKLRNTAYTLYVQNRNQDQPMPMGDVEASVYTSDGLIATIHPPPTCNATSNETAIEACNVYHDTPLVADPPNPSTVGDDTPVWATHTSIKSSEYLRLLCIDYSTGASIIHECQRYFSKTSWQNLRSVLTCPPSDDLCAAADDDQWFCSSNVYGGMYKCPDGGESMKYCPNRSPCVQPKFPVRANGRTKPEDYMCTQQSRQFNSYNFLAATKRVVSGFLKR